MRPASTGRRWRSGTAQVRMCRSMKSGDGVICFVLYPLVTAFSFEGSSAMTGHDEHDCFVFSKAGAELGRKQRLDRRWAWMVLQTCRSHLVLVVGDSPKGDVKVLIHVPDYYDRDLECLGPGLGYFLFSFRGKVWCRRRKGGHPPSGEQEPVLESFNEKLQHLLLSQGAAGLLEPYGSNTRGALYHTTPPPNTLTTTASSGLH